MRFAFLAIALLLFLLAVPAVAQIGLYNSEDGSGYYCNQIAPAGVQDVYVLVTGDWTRARFSIPTNHCIAPILIEPLNGTAITGDFSSGLTLTFSGCTSDRQAVARLVVYSNYGPCCNFGLTPHPAAGCVELKDCGAHTEAATWIPKISSQGYNGEQCHGFESVSGPPRNPIPSNGAGGVSTSLDLSWVMDPPIGGSCVLSWRSSSVFLGTTTTPPAIVGELEGTCHHVDGLLPGTTYYWKVWCMNWGVIVESPLWSFTTAGAVAVEQTTWGRVKALYR